MEILLPPKQCSDCGSINSETFTRLSEKGIRCLDCGRTITEPTMPKKMHRSWTNNTTTLETF